MKPNALVIAVIEQLGYTVENLDEDRDGSELWGTLEDVTRGGANAGWSGFTYYSDTVAFTKANRHEIMSLIRDMASDMGEDPIDFITGFRCFKTSSKSDEAIKEAAGRFVYGGHYRDGEHCDSLQVYNALAWFALESTAWRLTDN